MTLTKNNDITLDSKHNEMIEYFNKNTSVIIPSLMNKLKEYEIKKTNHPNNLTIVNECNDMIEKINKKVEKLNEEKNNYYLKNGKFIFDYYKNKQNIDKNKFTTNKKENNIFNNTDNYFFNLNTSNFNIDLFKYPKYLCNSCNKGELILIEENNNYCCNNCNIISVNYVTNDKTYKEPPKEISYYSYKKINHFKEIINQFQGKETTKIDDSIIENIKNQIKKERIYSVDQLTYKKIKEILKNLKYSHLYEHISFIKNKLGIKPPQFTPQLEEKLTNLFVDIQPLFHKHCPSSRRNFLNYYYILRKLCELLKETKYLNEIPQLKDSNKRFEHDEIWKKICFDINWKFIPTN
jgi:hypothetical protein